MVTTTCLIDGDLFRIMGNVVFPQVNWILNVMKKRTHGSSVNFSVCIVGQSVSLCRK